MGSRIGAPVGRCEYSSVTRVLIVDDHPSFRATARALLQAEGFEVVGEAKDGESALAEARRLQPQLVLLDVQLPDTDGFAVASRLTAAGNGPVVILTSSRDAADSMRHRPVSLSPKRSTPASGRRVASSSRIRCYCA